MEVTACRLKDTRLIIKIWSEAEFKDKTGALSAQPDTAVRLWFSVYSGC